MIRFKIMFTIKKYSNFNLPYLVGAVIHEEISKNYTDNYKNYLYSLGSSKIAITAP